MKRLVPFTVACLLALAGTAQAAAASQTITPREARVAVDHWWRGAHPPQIQWQHDRAASVLVMLRVPFRSADGSARGVEHQAVLVQRSGSSYRVRFLWATVRIVIRARLTPAPIG